MNTEMQICWRWKGISSKARFTKWNECEDVFRKMLECNCGHDSVRSMKVTLEQASESWTLRQRTCTFFGYDEMNIHLPVRIVQFRIKFKKS